MCMELTTQERLNLSYKPQISQIMETIERKYFADLDEAREYSRKRNEELKQQYNCYFAAGVWDAHEDNHWENGVWMRWIFIADIWPEQIIN